MADTSTYKGLELPKTNEKYNISVANKNNMVIDSELHRLDLKNESQDNLLATKEALSSESQRAASQEAQIIQNLNDEILRAKASEQATADRLTNEIGRAMTAENSNKDNMDTHISNQTNPHKVSKSQIGLGNAENKSSATIRSEITKSDVTNALGYTPYTPNEVDNKLSALETNIDWKESVPTFDDIASAYPEPQDGWTVNVNDTDYTYRFNGDAWIPISANAIPKATDLVDGLLSKEDHAKYEDASNKKHIHNNQSVLDNITSELKAIAFTGSYNDLTDKPKIPTSPEDIGAFSAGGGNIGNPDDTLMNLSPGGIQGDTNQILTGFHSVSATTLYYDGMDLDNRYVKQGNSENPNNNIHEINGDLRLKQENSNYGCKLNFGDGDLAYLQEYEDDYLKIYASNDLNLVGGGVVLEAEGEIIYCVGDFMPYSYPSWTRQAWDIGDSSHKWRNIYATNGTIITSDRNEKSYIAHLPDDLIKSFIMGLKPSSYKMVSGTSGRTHYGLISQDVEELMKKLGMDSMDFAGFIKSPKTVMTREEETLEEKGENGNIASKTRMVKKEQVIEGEYLYSLRYDEFIAPIIKMLQMQQKEIDDLKQSVQN